MNDYQRTIAAYDAAAAELASRYETLPDGASFADLHSLFPDGGLALDVGAGSGRDANWLRSLGFEVVAVEPAAGLRAEAIARHGQGIRWVDDRLPGLEQVHRYGLAFDLITLGAVWQHVAPGDRARAFRKLVTLLGPGGVLALSLRSGPSPDDRPMFQTTVGEIEGLARAHGMEVLKVQGSQDLQGRDDVSWTTMALRLPDDGTGALPLIRGIVLGDEKSSTYKLALLRSVARIAEQTPAVAEPSPDHADAVEVPIGLVALFWIRLYLPLVRSGLPQAPRNRGRDGLGFAKAGFRALLDDDLDTRDLRVGAVFSDRRAVAVGAAIRDAVTTIATMPANFTRFPNSDRRVFGVARGRSRRSPGLDLDLDWLDGCGKLTIPGHLWRALSRFGPWIEPMLVAEWARMTRDYADRMGVVLEPGIVEAALIWREPTRTTAIARMAAERLLSRGEHVDCVWTGKSLKARLDVDHCFPWTAWPCGDLWNLAPCDPRVNQHEKRDLLPSAAVLAASRERIVSWWERAYLADPALRVRFLQEAAAALPGRSGSAADIFSALEWRRLRLLQDQRVPEWHRLG